MYKGQNIFRTCTMPTYNFTIANASDVRDLQNHLLPNFKFSGTLTSDGTKITSFVESHSQKNLLGDAQNVGPLFADNLFASTSGKIGQTRGWCLNAYGPLEIYPGPMLLFCDSNSWYMFFPDGVGIYIKMDITPVTDDPPEQPSDNQPSDNQPSDNQPSDNQPSDNQPSDNQPSDNQPSDNQPSDNQPSDNQPSDNQPSDNQPSDNQPSDNQPSDNQPGDNQQTDNQPVKNSDDFLYFGFDPVNVGVIFNARVDATIPLQLASNAKTLQDALAFLSFTADDLLTPLSLSTSLSVSEKATLVASVKAALVFSKVISSFSQNKQNVISDSSYPLGKGDVLNLIFNLKLSVLDFTGAKFDVNPIDKLVCFRVTIGQ